MCTKADCAPRWETGPALDGDYTGVSGGGSHIKGDSMDSHCICAVFKISYSPLIQLSVSGASSLNIRI